MYKIVKLQHFIESLSLSHTHTHTCVRACVMNYMYKIVKLQHFIESLSLTRSRAHARAHTHTYFLTKFSIDIRKTYTMCKAKYLSIILIRIKIFEGKYLKYIEL